VHHCIVPVTDEELARDMTYGDIQCYYDSSKLRLLIDLDTGSDNKY